jgi:hypothetical protein
MSAAAFETSSRSIVAEYPPLAGRGDKDEEQYQAGDYARSQGVPPVANNEWKVVERRRHRGPDIAARGFTAVNAAYNRASRRPSPYSRPKDEGTVSFRGAKKLAAEMDVTAVLDYIPMAERWACYWEHPDDKTILVDPKRGKLEWCGTRAERPGNDGQMQRAKLFVCSGLVGPTVRQVVGEMMWRRDGWKAAEELKRRQKREKEEAEKIARIQEWEKTPITPWGQDDQVRDAIAEWKESVAQGYHIFLSGLTPDEVYEVVAHKKTKKEDFLNWLDQYAWDAAQVALEEDMEKLKEREDKAREEKKRMEQELEELEVRVLLAEYDICD